MKYILALARSLWVFWASLGVLSRLAVLLMVVVVVGVVASIVSLIGGEPSTPSVSAPGLERRVSPTPSPTATPAPQPTTTPEIVGFPYAWRENGIEITVVEIKMLGTGTLEEIGLRGVKADEGYQFVGVRVSFRNTGHREWSGGTYVGPLLELKTDSGNIYKGEGHTRAPRLRPEEVREQWDYFEIRQDEKPMELWDYAVVNPEAPPGEQLGVVRVWKLGWQ